MTSSSIHNPSPLGNNAQALAAMADVLSSLAGASDRPSLLAALATCVVSLPADTYVLSAFRDRGAELELVGALEQSGAVVPIAESDRLGRAIHESTELAGLDEPFLSDDIAADTRLDESSRRILVEELRLRGVVAFRLSHGGTLFGSLAAGLRERRGFAPEEVQILRAIAQIVAVALAHIANREQLARKVQEMHGLYRAGEALAAIEQEGELLQRAAELLVTEIRYLSCWIAMLTPEGNALRAAAGAGGATTEHQPDISLEDRTRIVVEAFHVGKPVVYEDIVARADMEGWGDIARSAGFRCSVVIPLRATGQTLGALCVGSAAPSAGDDEVSLLAAFGNQLASAVERVRRMEREREQQVAKLRRAQERQARLLDVVRELSTPVIPVHDGVVVLPLVGTIDSSRNAQIMASLLHAVQHESASVVIVDITGVPMVDSTVANHLLQAIRAASLLGARSVLVGISAAVAQTMVQLGIDLSSVETRSNLQAGIAYALGLLRLEIRPVTRAH